jgi:hypothetical protein
MMMTTCTLCGLICTSKYVLETHRNDKHSDIPNNFTAKDLQEPKLDHINKLMIFTRQLSKQNRFTGLQVDDIYSFAAQALEKFNYNIAADNDDEDDSSGVEDASDPDGQEISDDDDDDPVAAAVVTLTANVSSSSTDAKETEKL